MIVCFLNIAYELEQLAINELNIYCPLLNVFLIVFKLED